jgi:hypothetical protein
LAAKRQQAFFMQAKKYLNYQLNSMATANRECISTVEFFYMVDKPVVKNAAIRKNNCYQSFILF